MLWRKIIGCFKLKETKIYLTKLQPVCDFTGATAFILSQ